MSNDMLICYVYDTYKSNISLWKSADGTKDE